MPLFSLLRSNYPNTRTPCTNAGGEPTYSNQCAIRMSIALLGAGVSLESYAGTRCPHGHARLSQQLADWLRDQLGAPANTAVSSTEQQLRQAISQLQGIIFFQDCFMRPGESTRQGDHIDLWDLGRRVPPIGWFPRCGDSAQVWFWPLTG